MLRLIVLLLLLLNIGYFAWSQGWLLPYGWGPAQQREPQRLAQQVRPEAIQIVPAHDGTVASPAATALSAPAPTPAPALVPAPATAPASAPKVVASAPGAAVCLLSDPIDASRAQTLTAVLTAQLAPNTWTLDEHTTPARWIIYMGRFASAAEQAAKRAQLVELKVKFEAIDVPALSPGFSLGSFTSRADTEAALQTLNKRGVRTAKMTQVQPAQSSVRLRLPAIDTTLPALQRIREAVPELVLQPCR